VEKVERMKELKTGRGIFNRYCKDILSNKIPACSYVKKAIERCLKDFDRIKEDSFEYEFDWAKCEKFLNFSRTIPLPDKDEFLNLLPWQIFCLFNLIGWVYKKNKDKRRFRSGMIQVPRKNGKTTGLMFPLLIWDFITEKAAESYFFEKDEPQAKKIYKELYDGVLSKHELLKDRIHQTIFAITAGDKRIAYFTAESEGIDSYRPSLCVIDEYFCFPSDRPVTAMIYGGRGRDSSLTLIITTAGSDISLPCYDETLKTQKILNKIIEQDDYFGIIYTIDDTVKWDGKEAYYMANPSIKTSDGIGIIDPKLLEQDLQDAKNQLSHKPDYLAKTLNVWTTGTSSWISLDRIKFPESVDFSTFKKKPCYGALDLSYINDWSAYTLCFSESGKYYFKHRFYIPFSTLEERYRKENINIIKWIEQKLITVIYSDTIDYDFIFNDIKNDYEQFDIKELAFDVWNSREFINKINNELPQIDVFSFPQSLQKMSDPTKQLEKIILDQKMITNCQEIMLWMLSNVQIKVDANHNYKPLKEYKSSTKRIDGVITSIMSLSRAMANKNEEQETANSFEDILKLF
jgi:phage terminase large subunit-like protein